MKLLRYITLALCMLVAVVASAQKTYIVCVGLNEYDNGENPLPCSRGDANAMAKFFHEYNGSEVFMLLDKNATRKHILTVLKRQFDKAQEEDEIIFAYSGHGFKGGITCYDTNNVLFCEEIQDIMSASKATRKVMFINACRSGSFKNKEFNKFDYGRRNTDVMLYLSSRSDESSWESTAMANSFFFNRLIEALNGAADANTDGNVTARELFNYVNSKVVSDTQGIQHPQMYGKFSDNMVVVVTQ